MGDVVYALRTMIKNPGFTLIVLATLALGVGGSTTMFSFVDGVLLRPLPYQDPDRLVLVWQDMSERGGPAEEWSSPGLYLDWRAESRSFQTLAAFRGWLPNLTGGPEAEQLSGAIVSQDYSRRSASSPRSGATSSRPKTCRASIPWS